MAPIIIGFIAGTAVGIFNFKLLLWMTAKVMHTDPKQAAVIAIGGFLLRTALYIGVVAAAIYIDWIHVFGVGGGLLAASLLNLRDRNKIIE